MHNLITFSIVFPKKKGGGGQFEPPPPPIITKCSPVAFDLLSMDTSDRVHEISRVVYSPVTVSEGTQSVVAPPQIRIDSSPWLHVLLDESLQCLLVPAVTGAHLQSEGSSVTLDTAQDPQPVHTASPLILPPANLNKEKKIF